MKVTNKFVLFWGDYLGNWTKLPRPIVITDLKKYGDGKDYELKFYTSEQYFMYLKACYFKDEDTAELIASESDPKKAKDLGRKVRGFDEAKWEEVREHAMFSAVWHRAHVDPEFVEKLLNPDWRNLEFVEASPKDRIWGIGLKEDDPLAWDKSNWKGLNLLGKCLCELRRYILFCNRVNTFSEHAFIREMIWCPSQIEYYFTDPSTGKMWVVYMRWRYSDPWTVELTEVQEPKSPRRWEFSDETKTILEREYYKEEEYDKMQKDVIRYLRKVFPLVDFPEDPEIKDMDLWDGLDPSFRIDGKVWI